MRSEQRSKIIIGAGVTIVLIAVIALFATRGSSSATEPTCTYVTQPPNLKELQKYKNADNTSMATFSGYVTHTQDSAKIYLPIEFDSIRVTKTEQGHKLEAKSHCTTLEMVNYLDEANEKVTYFTMIHITPDGNEAECIMRTVNIAYTNTTHYSCYKTVTYSCTNEKSKDPIADLVVENLEFEVDSDPAKVAKDEWSKPATVCT